jgi:phosphatidylserine/phosphatidylglycerophosphate/cardiolipin synthase-like enzyme
VSNEGITVNAIAGTHVVILGFDLDEARRKDCLGFAIQREDKTEEERYWLRGMKTFPSTNPQLGPGGTVSSRDHPFQTFQWADYSAKPAHEYAFTVVPLYGEPAALREGPRLTVEIETEVEIGAPHSMFFNRGSVATQEYARQFQNIPPDKLEGEASAAAYRWLSRGLEEAMVAFIDRAADASWGIHGAIYELRWPNVIKALREAHRRGAQVEVLYHGKNDTTGPPNAEAIAKGKIKGLCRARTEGYLMHNKFFVLTKNEKPVSVWTGSTNVTVNGIFGHMNCGHIVEDAAVAGEFLEYWGEMWDNQDHQAEQGWMGENNPRPPSKDDKEKPLTTVFSPHTDDAILDWYRDISASAKDALMMSFAFGMDDRFKAVYRKDDQILRYALMDKAAAGRGEKLKQGKEEIEEIRRRPNVVVAIGNHIATNAFDRWLKEQSRITKAQVPWVHTKFMLVDPLGDDPTVVTGSANWSDESTHKNAENMLVIRGDKRVADTYFGEFMRLHSHYAFREAVARALETGERWEPQNLAEDSSWLKDYFDPDDERCWKRRYFAQSD